MNKEEAIKKCREAIEFNKTVRDKNNNVLSHAIGLLEKNDGEYERGLNDGWGLAKKVVYMSTDDRFHAFGCKSPALTLEHHSGLDARKLYNEYMEEKKKKEEEAAKPKLGDVVHIFGLNGTFIADGVLIGMTCDKYYILRKSRGPVPEAWDIESYEFEKTGEYIDIQGMLDKIG